MYPLSLIACKSRKECRFLKLMRHKRKYSKVYEKFETGLDWTCMKNSWKYYLDMVLGNRIYRERLCGLKRKYGFSVFKRRME